MENRKIRILVSWLIFAVSFLVYLITLEPTTSFWDCSEFILSATKLEVNHASGAPLFALLGRLFSFLSFGNPERIAWSVNMMSGFFSAMTVFFLFQVISLMAEKVVRNFYSGLICAATGSLAFAFTDSFWFSAVEAEVYSLSMFFFVVVFWAILKWEQNAGRPKNEKWLLFIAFITGLGMGVHLLNLLVLPAVAIIIGIKTYKTSFKYVLAYFILGCLAIALVMGLIIPGFLRILSFFDYYSVNHFNQPLNSGVATGALLMILVISFLIVYFRRKNKYFAESVVLGVGLLLMGFSVYAVYLLRSQAGTPVNIGQPDNIYSLIDYLNREQYPKRPLVKGEYYSSAPIGISQRSTQVFRNGRYTETELNADYVYPDNLTGIFPRMYSSEPGHIEAYQSWVKVKGRKVTYTNRNGELQSVVVPTFAENLKFFFRYQVNYMYVRYLLWNFAGRQNDFQGRGEVTKGNWISGIKPLDTLRLGSQQGLPQWMTANKSCNRYFFLPLLLGFTGLWFLFSKSPLWFYITLFLFLISGLGLTVYLNEVPVVPRERDYVYVGSFLVFSIWIGFSFAAVAEWLAGKKQWKTYGAATLIFVSGPLLLLTRNFDDHNRSKRYSARDFARNILESCPQNAILFTSGDNDTYPVLYCQEVENIRQDVKIVVMPFLGANWFIEQLKFKKYQNNGLKMILPQQLIDNGRLDYLEIAKKTDKNVTFRELLEFIRLKSTEKNDSNFSLSIPVANLSLQLKDAEGPAEIPVSFKGKQFLYKHEIVFWDIVSSNINERPVCFVSKNDAAGFGLLNNLETKGLVYQLTGTRNTIKNPSEMPPVDAEKQYELLMNRFRWGNLSDPRVHVDFTNKYNLNVFQLKNNFNFLAQTLIEKGENAKAREVLDRIMHLFPVEKFGFQGDDVKTIELYSLAGETPKADELFGRMLNSLVEELGFYEKLDGKNKVSVMEDVVIQYITFERLAKLGEKVKFSDSQKAIEYFNSFTKKFKMDFS